MPAFSRRQTEYRVVRDVRLRGGTRKPSDKTLALADGMLHVLHMNLRAGRAPDPEKMAQAV
ncbi:hypothetical protein [Marivita geojedonensis]|uniref:hypothetical protein n=1 Tax=Marivita geojedonensis TaxID=1123756 RepID=UPI0014738232|nr:hypothetical protein [Marivita geojedonensis]